MPGPIGHYVYTRDDGTDYKIRQDVSNATAVGNVAATTEPHLPAGYHPRYIWAEKSTGERRKIPVSDVSSDIWTGVTATINLYVEGTAAAVAFDIRGRVGERRYDI
jgi:hypothetical protein